jgi:hypothetical protein
VPGAVYDLVALSVVAVPPSAKFQACWVSEPVVITELLVKVKLLPVKHCPMLLMANEVEGMGCTTACCVVLSLQPLLLVDTSLTVYVPGAAYDLVALSVVAVPPSPKSQLYWASEPVVIEDVLVKPKLLSVKHCALLLIVYPAAGIGFTTTCCIVLSLQPSLLVETSLTE